MEAARARALLASARVARLATADATAQPHVVPIVFAVISDTIYSPIDDKPKSGRGLRRIDNIAGNPRVSVLADHYDDDWHELWWVRADGFARVLNTTQAEAVVAIERLAARYQQYATAPPPGPVIAIEVRRWSGWAAVVSREHE